MSGINAEELDKEVLPFLSPGSRPDVRSIAMEYLLGLTGTADGQRFIANRQNYVKAILGILNDEHPAIAKDAYLALVNLTTNETTSWLLLNLDSHKDFLFDLLKYVLEPSSKQADFACMLLANLSRGEKCATKIVKLMIEKKEEVGFDKLITVFCTVDHNKDAKMHYLGSLLSNLSQIKEARYYILAKERCVVQRLLTFVQYEGSLERRGGVIGTLRNCCFETEYHEWLLSDKVDLLPRLLLPLAGPEEFDDDDNEQLPDDLQYLEPDKKREPDADLRVMLIEAINQLLSTKPCREYIRSKNAYVILRELDNWEKDPACTLAIQNTISVLLADEPEEGMENLRAVDIPSEVEPKLQKAYDKQLEEVAMETAKMEEVDMETAKMEEEEEGKQGGTAES